MEDEEDENFELDEEIDEKQLISNEINFGENPDAFLSNNDLENGIENENEEIKDNKEEIQEEDESNDDSKSDKRFP